MEFGRVLLISVLLLWCSASASMESRSEDSFSIAHDVAIKAAGLVKERGVDAARPMFHEYGEYRFGEIYVSVIDMKGTWLVYPLNLDSEGKNIYNLLDPDGKSVIPDILEIAKTQCQGWIQYRWRNPETNLFRNKRTFVVCVPERNVVVYVGAYQ